MADVARFFMEFCMEESCGKCIPCRTGTVQMHGLLTKILGRKATARDLQHLEDLCVLVRSTCLWGLGQTAPNPVVSTLRFFRKEYTDLLQEERPSGAEASAQTEEEALSPMI
jgi:bidirectional [NiFe] hydrogenase diaphorase subunit